MSIPQHGSPEQRPGLPGAALSPSPSLPEASGQGEAGVQGDDPSRGASLPPSAKGRAAGGVAHGPLPTLTPSRARPLSHPRMLVNGLIQDRGVAGAGPRGPQSDISYDFI